MNDAITVTRNVRIGIKGSGRITLLGDTTNLPNDAIRAPVWSTRSVVIADDDAGVVISKSANLELVTYLTLKYGVIVETSLAAANRYCIALKRDLSDLISAQRKINGAGSISFTDFALLKLYESHIPYATIQGESDISEDSSKIYFIGVPGHLMLGMWNRYTDDTPIVMHIATQEGVSSVNLSEDVLPLCTDYKSIKRAGCLSCDKRDNCIESLIHQDLTTDPVNKNRLSRFIGKKYNVLPHYDCSAAYPGDPINYTHIKMKGALENNRSRVIRRKAIASNAKFARDNCKVCTMQSVCGSGKTYGYGNNPLGVQSFCTGKTAITPSITEDNYIKIFTILLNSLCIARNNHRPLLPKDQDLIDACLLCIKDWVESSGHMPGHAHYFYTKLNNSRGKKAPVHDCVYVVPRKLLELASLLDIVGCFVNNTRRYCSWDPLISGKWLVETSTEMTSFLPNKSQQSGWVGILPLTQKVSPTNTMFAASNVFECVDTSLLANLHGVKPKSSSRVFSTKDSRIHLVTEFIKCFVSPGRIMWYGNFASSKAHLPTGISGYRNHVYFPKLSSYANVEIILQRLILLDMSDSSKIKLLKSNNKLKEIWR